MVSITHHVKSMHSTANHQALRAVYAEKGSETNGSCNLSMYDCYIQCVNVRWYPWALDPHSSARLGKTHVLVVFVRANSMYMLVIFLSLLMLVVLVILKVLLMVLLCWYLAVPCLVFGLQFGMCEFTV